MNNPIKEFIKEYQTPKSHTPEWVSESADAIESAYDKAGDELSSAFERGKDYYKSVQKRFSTEVNDVDVLFHNNPYPAILIGMLASSVIGYLVACRINSCSATRRRNEE